MTIGLSDQIIIAVIFIVITWISLNFRKYIKNADDYFISGRKITFALIVSSMVASWHSVSYYLWLPGTIFTLGWSGWIVTCGGYVMMDLISGYFFSYKARMLRVWSLPELFRTVYGNTAQLISSIAYFMFMATFSAMEIIAIGLIINFIFGIPVSWGITISTIIILIYVIIGGQYSEYIADFIQYILMALGLLIIAFFCFKQIFHDYGSFDAAVKSVWNGPKLRPTGEWTLTQIIGFSIAALQGIFSPVHMSKAASAKTPKIARDGILCSLYNMLAHDWLLIIIGISAAILLKVAPENTDQTTLLLASQLLPSTIMAIFLAGLIANGLATINTTFVIGGTILGKDIFQKYIKPKATDKQIINAGRLGMVLLGIVAIIIGFYSDSLLNLIYYSGQIFAPIFVIPILFAFLYKKRMSSMSSVFAMILGFAGSVTWIILKEPSIFSIPIPGSVFGIVLSLLGFIIGNFFGQKKENIWVNLNKYETPKII
ncbi:MAG: sodium:solute symporter family protein [Candidatus Parcubacteria bacterium]|nr:sodium:solute symporter family protein [Candidatus Parcubacteria bacterium]